MGRNEMSSNNNNNNEKKGKRKNNVTWRMRDRRFGGWAYGGLSLNSCRGEHMRQSRLQFGFIRAWFRRTTTGSSRPNVHTSSYTNIHRNRFLIVFIYLYFHAVAALSSLIY